MSGMITAVAATAVVGAYSSSQATKASNRASEQNARLTREEAKRRYALESGIAQQQMSEQQNLAMEVTLISIGIFIGMHLQSHLVFYLVILFCIHCWVKLALIFRLVLSLQKVVS